MKLNTISQFTWSDNDLGLILFNLRISGARVKTILSASLCSQPFVRGRPRKIPALAARVRAIAFVTSHARQCEKGDQHSKRSFGPKGVTIARRCPSRFFPRSREAPLRRLAVGIFQLIFFPHARSQRPGPLAARAAPDIDRVLVYTGLVYTGALAGYPPRGYRGEGRGSIRGGL